jgi:ABC-type sulfate transport system permease subunit
VGATAARIMGAAGAVDVVSASAARARVMGMTVVILRAALRIRRLTI